MQTSTQWPPPFESEENVACGMAQGRKITCDATAKRNVSGEQRVSPKRPTRKANAGRTMPQAMEVPRDLSAAITNGLRAGNHRRGSGHEALSRIAPPAITSNSARIAEAPADFPHPYSTSQSLSDISPHGSSPNNRTQCTRRRASRPSG